MLFAGLMFKEGKPQEPTTTLPINRFYVGKQEAVLRDLGKSKWSKERPDEPTFLITENAQHRTRFSDI